MNALVAVILFMDKESFRLLYGLTITLLDSLHSTKYIGFLREKKIATSMEYYYIARIFKIYYRIEFGFINLKRKQRLRTEIVSSKLLITLSSNYFHIPLHFIFYSIESFLHIL